MDDPAHGSPKNPSGTSSSQTHRRTRRRKRTILNLGMPFFQVDDFLNQSEDAVALGYRVLEETVKEIQTGYEQAKQFNELQRKWDGKGPAPSIPWEQLVDRLQRFQDIALQTAKDGSDIFFDSIRSGTDSMKSAAKTWEQTRDDVEAKPVMAGPVFSDLIEITAAAGGAAPALVTRPIRHRGLTRLRIHAVMDPKLKELVPVGTDASASHSGDLDVRTVSFEPATAKDDEEYSVLRIDVGPVKASQKPAKYEGFIRAANFELAIARLRVTVTSSKRTAAAPAKQAGPAAGGKKTKAK